MKIILQALLVIAAIWAILPAVAYGLLFASVAHWSSLIDLGLALSCITLSLSAFMRVATLAWLAALMIITGFSAIGQFYHFQDSGESGPLPFEWINGYLLHGLPLLTVSILLKVHKYKSEAQSGPGE